MSIIEKNKEIIKRCCDCLESCNGTAKRLHELIRGLLDMPLDVDKLNEAVNCLTGNLEKLRYEYNTMFQEYMMYNGEFIMHNFLEKQKVELFLSSAIIMTEDSQLLYRMCNDYEQSIKVKIKPTGSDIAFGFYNENPDFEHLSTDGKITMRWQQTIDLFQRWAIMRTCVMRLEKVVEYLNCIMLATPKVISEGEK